MKVESSRNLKEETGKRDKSKFRERGVLLENPRRESNKEEKSLQKKGKTKWVKPPMNFWGVRGPLLNLKRKGANRGGGVN